MRAFVLVAAAIALVATAAGFLATQSAAPILTAAVASLALAAFVLGFSLVWRSPLPTLRTDFGLRLAASTLILALTAYTLAFNHLPGTARLAGAGVIAVGLFAVGLAMLWTDGSRAASVLLALIGAMTAISIFGGLFGMHPFDPLGFFRIWFPLAIACGFVVRPDLISQRVAGISSVSLIALGTLSSYSHGTKFLNNAYRLAPFTGGQDGVHSSAYVLAIAAITVNELRRARAISPWVAYPAMAFAIAGVAGLRVSTALAMLATYFVLRAALASRSATQWVGVILLATAILAVGYHARVQLKQAVPSDSQATSVTADKLSSGRLGAWSDRLTIVNSERTTRLVFGGGIGAGAISTSAWNGAVKTSHEDFLTILIDDGMVTLFIYIALLGLLTKLGGRETYPIIAALVMGSAISNALFVRPMISPFLWVAVAVAASTALSTASEPVPDEEQQLSASSARSRAVSERLAHA